LFSRVAPGNPQNILRWRLFGRSTRKGGNDAWARPTMSFRVAITKIKNGCHAVINRLLNEASFWRATIFHDSFETFSA
jgi:hypothetical protein